MAKNAPSLGERLRLIFAADAKKDKAAAFLIPLLTSIWDYAAQVQPEIANSPADVDRAMQSGFNWEMGPFAMRAAAAKGGPRRERRAAFNLQSQCRPQKSRLLAD